MFQVSVGSMIISPSSSKSHVSTKWGLPYESHLPICMIWAISQVFGSTVSFQKLKGSISKYKRWLSTTRANSCSCLLRKSSMNFHSSETFHYWMVKPKWRFSLFGLCLDEQIHPTIYESQVLQPGKQSWTNYCITSDIHIHKSKEGRKRITAGCVH